MPELTPTQQHTTMDSNRRGIMWNPWNKVVQAHDDGTISHPLTNIVRNHLGLPTPWTPDHAQHEVHEKPIHLTKTHYPTTPTDAKEE